LPTVQVSIEDSSGNVVTTATNPVTLSIQTNPSGGTLSGTLTVAASNGVATFSNLHINLAGNGYTLKAVSGALAPRVRAPFNVFAVPAQQLVFTRQPSSTTGGVSISPPIQVTLEDLSGNVATTATTPVTLALTSGTGTSGALLSGTLTVTPVNGVASFPNLKV